MEPIRRRSFLSILGMGVASLLVFPAMTCNKAGDALSNLRGVLNAVEQALKLLGTLTNLLPDQVNTAATYLLKVVSFVDSVGQILENAGLAAADKARQILQLGGDLVFPVIPPPIGPILQAVAGAVDKFLSLFGTDAAHARSAKVDNPPNLEFNQKQIDQLHQIEADAKRDRVAVEDWQRRALATPAK